MLLWLGETQSKKRFGNLISTIYLDDQTSTIWLGDTKPNWSLSWTATNPSLEWFSWTLGEKRWWSKKLSLSSSSTTGTSVDHSLHYLRSWRRQLSLEREREELLVIWLVYSWMIGKIIRWNWDSCWLINLPNWPFVVAKWVLILVR